MVFVGKRLVFQELDDVLAASSDALLDVAAGSNTCIAVEAGSSASGADIVVSVDGSKTFKHQTALDQS
jgi:hypothetical protein